MFLLTGAVFGVVGVGGAQTDGWTQFQGSAEHQGSAPEAAPPPYSVSWRFAIEPKKGIAVSPPILAGDQVVVAGWDAIYGVDPVTGEQAWSVPRENGQPTTPAVAQVKGGGALLYTEGDSEETSHLVAIDLETHAPLWEAPFALEDVSYSGVSVDGGTAFVGDDLGDLYAVDVATGHELWKAELDAGVEGAIAVSGGLVIAPSQNLVHVSETTSTSSPEAATITAFEEATGERAWRYATDPGLQLVSAPTVADSSIFVGVYDGRVGYGSIVALDAADGHELWDAPIRTAGAYIAPTVSTAYSDGVVLVGDITGGLIAINSATGNVVWDMQTSTPNGASSALVVGSEGYALVGLADGRAVAVDIGSGHLVWRESTGSGQLGGAVAGEGVLVFGKDGTKGGLVAFEHDSQAELLDLRSPSEVELGPLLGRFAIGFVAISALLLIPFRFLARRLGPAEFPEGDAEAQDETQVPGEDENEEDR